MGLDLLIRNGTIVDGSGAARYREPGPRRRGAALRGSRLELATVPRAARPSSQCIEGDGHHDDQEQRAQRLNQPAPQAASIVTSTNPQSRGEVGTMPDQR